MAAVALETLQLEAVSPAMAEPLNVHWKVGTGKPVATTTKVALEPWVIVWRSGAVVMTGACNTVRVAAWEVTEPATLVIFTV